MKTTKNMLFALLTLCTVGTHQVASAESLASLSQDQTTKLGMILSLFIKLDPLVKKPVIQFDGTKIVKKSVAFPSTPTATPIVNNLRTIGKALMVENNVQKAELAFNKINLKTTEKEARAWLKNAETTLVKSINSISALEKAKKTANKNDLVHLVEVSLFVLSARLMTGEQSPLQKAFETAPKSIKDAAQTVSAKY